MNQPDIFTTWRKSSRSSGGGNCVEVAFAPNGAAGVRDSKDPTGAVLIFTSIEWKAFTAGIRYGDF
jgi:hypothetical protein